LLETSVELPPRPYFRLVVVDRHISNLLETIRTNRSVFDRFQTQLSVHLE